MKNWKEWGRLIEVTTQERTLRIWSQQQPLMEELATKLQELRKAPPKKDEKHTVEQDSRIMANKRNWQKILDVLVFFIYLLKVETYGADLRVNIYSKEEARNYVNKDKHRAND